MIGALPTALNRTTTVPHTRRRHRQHQTTVPSERAGRIQDVKRTFGGILFLVGFQSLDGLHERLATFAWCPRQGGLATEVFRTAWWLRHRLAPIVVVTVSIVQTRARG